MNLRSAGMWLSLASACLVVALVVWDSGNVSPGPISAVHARSAGIDGDACEDCHGGFGGSLSSACGECHAKIVEDVAQGRGFHGGMSGAASCGTCHSEHHGADFALVGPAVFARAGVPDRDAYDHAHLDFTLAGRHASLACRECHPNADAVLLAKGAPRFLGLSQDCAACHDDPHAGRLPDCRSCHGESEPFERVAAFRHPDTFALVGAHAGRSCVECHAKGSEHAIENSALAAHPGATPRPARACQDCHASPHAEPFVSAIAARLAVANGAACASCHPVEGGAFGHEPRMTPEDHALTGFPLVAPHAQVSCASCHARLEAPRTGALALAAFRESHPGRSADDCAACHADPHGGQFQGGRYAEQGCLACHDRHRFDPPAFGIEQHAATAFALTGAHAATGCSECHTQAPGQPRRFRGTDSECAACHADAHRGFFADRGRAAGASGCELCHSTTAFADAGARAFDHGAWTGFALDGAHADQACEACHARAAVRDARGRAFGWIADRASGPPQACATCHADVHRGFFARTRGRHAGTMDCAQCHGTASFAAARDGFDHGGRTAFALDGAHAALDCAACHSTVPGPAGTAHGLRVTLGGPGPFDDCAACHADPHAGSFDAVAAAAGAAERAACTACHSTHSFEAARDGFDHARWTGFALEGVHARADCGACHARIAEPDAAGRRFGRARGTDCADCHADPHVGQFASAGRTDCARCHTQTSDFLATVFDHRTHSRFQLDERHARLSCDACHVPWPVPGAGEAVRYKPLGTQCGDCHDPRRFKDETQRTTGSMPW